MTQFKVLGNEKQPMVTESTTGWTGVRSGREEGNCRGIGCLMVVAMGLQKGSELCDSPLYAVNMSYYH